MTYTYNHRQRLIRRAKRLLERVHHITMDLHSFGVRSEELDVLFHIEELFPVEVKHSHGHGL